MNVCTCYAIDLLLIKCWNKMLYNIAQISLMDMRV